MAFAETPPQPPAPPPPQQPRIDLRTGLLTKEAQEYEFKLAAWHRALAAYLERLRAAIP